MAIIIGEVHDFIRTILKKNKGGFVSPKDIDIAINRATYDLVARIADRFRQGEKFPYDHLLVKRAEFDVTTSTTVKDIPVDYMEALTIYCEDEGNSVTLQEGTILNYDTFLERKNSSILAPTLYYPIATIYKNTNGDSKVQFLPAPPSATTYKFTLVYLKTPATAEYVYTSTNGNISQTSDDVTDSTNIDMDNRYFSEIATRALMYLGISLRDADVATLETIRTNNNKANP